MATSPTRPMATATLRRLMAEVSTNAERWQTIFEAEARGRLVGLHLVRAMRRGAR